jgi:hypothetical protein
MRYFLVLSLCGAGLLGVTTSQTHAEGIAKSKQKFYFKDANGAVQSAAIISHYSPPARVDGRIDPRLRHAATIAQERAHARSKARCWHYVKEALVASGVVSAYPKTAYAYQAGAELVRDYGFQKLALRDPYAAPVGAVLVYSHGRSGAGHVEIRTSDGFVSDFRSKTCCRYPLLAIYAKF